MNKVIYKIFIVAFASMVAFSACSDSSSNTEGINEECSIINMTLGTLYKTVSTQNEAGKDTTYWTTFNGSYYNLLVDQLNHVIYNPDSLPVGTDIKRVIFNSISSDGNVAFRGSDGVDSIYSSTDTLDFTKPRTFICYSSTFSSKQEYTVKINVHQVEPDEFHWENLGTFDEVKSLTAQKAISKDNSIYLFGTDGPTGKAVLLTTPAEGKVNWTKKEITDISSFTPAGVQLFNGKFYTSDGQTLYQSADGITWTAVSTDFQPEAIVAATDVRLFAQKGNALYVSSDGQNWSKEEMDGESDKLPTANWTSAMMDMNFNKNFEFILLGGSCSNEKNTVWKKVIDRLNIEDDCWSLYDDGEEIGYPFPNVNNPIIINYDTRMLNIGLQGDTLSLFYVSEDAGRNWEPDNETYIHPAGIKATNFSCIVDNSFHIWICCAGSGEIWKGRINRLSFKNEKTSFTE